MKKIKINYNKFINSLGNNFQIIEENEKKLKIQFYPPTISEAASSEELDVEQPNVSYIIECSKEGDDITIDRVYLVKGNKTRDLSEDEIRLWIEYLVG
jgi:hypothetical protein